MIFRKIKWEIGQIFISCTTISKSGKVEKINVFWNNLKQENKQNPSFLFVLLTLLSIPLSYTINGFCIGLLVFHTLFYYQKNSFVLNKSLLLPIALYLLMLLSFFWTIDLDRTLPALSKELSLLIISLCFMLFGGFEANQKQRLLHFYSHGIVFFAIYYLLHAIYRFGLTSNSDVFFYHELVTKDVNAIHVSVYMAIAFFYFFTKTIKTYFDYFALCILLLMVFLLSSKNIIVAFIGLMVLYHLFYSKLSKQMRLKNMIVFAILLFSLTFIGRIKDRFRAEYETIMTDSTVNDVISKTGGVVYNVSIKQAWTQESFKANDYFPGTAFRVYQFRIFLELIKENSVFWTGFGLNASYKKIEEKGIQHNLYLGEDGQEGYQKKNFHNQFVQNFADLGVFGFLILVIMLALNLKNAIKMKDFLHISFAILMISLFLTESFLWRQRGVVFFTTMYCIFNYRFQKAGNND